MTDSNRRRADRPGHARGTTGAALILSLALTLALGSTAHGIVMHDGAKNNPGWQQEYKDNGNQFPQVVALAGFNGTSWRNIGSGTIYGDGRQIVGAAHSAVHRNNGVPYENYAIITGTHIIDDYWGIYYTSQVTLHPGFNGTVGSTDFAVWELDEPIPGITPATLYQGPDSALLGSLITMAGFGMFGYPSDGWVDLDGAKRGATNVLSRIGWPIYGAGNDQLFMHFEPPGHWDYQRLGGTLGDFDSGGGWFTNINGQWELCAATGYVVGGYAYGSTGATSTSQHAQWLNSFVPEPSCLMLLTFGAVLLGRRRA